MTHGAKACGEPSRKEGLWIRKVTEPDQGEGATQEGTLEGTGGADPPEDQGGAAHSPQLSQVLRASVSPPVTYEW